MRIAFLGLGKMGTAIVRLFLEHGEDVTVWNRTTSRAEALQPAGAKLAPSAAEAAAACDVLFTMVMDDPALESLLDDGKVLEALRKDAIHVSLSTLSVQLSRKLTAEHAARGQHFVGAPVFGRPHIAEQGKLWIAVGGAPEPVEKILPLLQHISRGVTIVAEQPSSAHALKLGGNFLITAMIASLSEGMIYAESQGIAPQTFLETVNSALFQSPFYDLYGKIMLHPPDIPGSTIALGEKDTRLFREAGHAERVKTPLADVFYATLHRAFEAGMKDADWAAGYYRLEQGMLASDGETSAH
jgi:3-hydroxyisobutyrate dehydrogenase-like beta-hydroxyacid dehydrogenase